MVKEFLPIVISLAVVATMLADHWWQRKHNILSARPIPEVTGDPYTHSLSICLSNKGVGPLLIERLEVVNDIGTENDTIYDMMQEVDEPAVITFWARNINGRTIAADRELTLIKVESCYDDYTHEEESLMMSLAAVYADFSSMQVIVHYTDIYGSRFPTYKKSLSAVFDNGSVEVMT